MRRRSFLRLMMIGGSAVATSSAIGRRPLAEAHGMNGDPPLSLYGRWVRRARLTCPSREQLGSYVLQVLEPELQSYLDFHLRTIGCPFCQANLADLQSRQEEAAAQVQERRKRYFTSSMGNSL